MDAYMKGRIARMHARMLTRMHARPSQTCVHACPCTWNLSYISFDMSACKYIVHTSIHAWCMQPCKALDLGPVRMHARACPHAHKCTSACQSVHASACTHTLGIAQKRLLRPGRTASCTCQHRTVKCMPGRGGAVCDMQINTRS